MTISLFVSKVDHCRIGPQVHRFGYLNLSALVDLDDLQDLSRPEVSAFGRWFSYNRFGVFSIRDSDYLPGKPGSIKERLLAHLQEFSGKTSSMLTPPGGWGRIELLTSPRFFGYVFNPVNFYLCYLPGAEQPEACLAEVNNTFGETHLYLGEPVEGRAAAGVRRFRTKKEFHVSPFYDRSGDYSFTVRRKGERIDVRVNLIRQEKIVFTSGMKGRALPLEPAALWRHLLSGFRYGWLTLPRIILQAGILRFKKGLPVYSKPIPQSAQTIGKRKPTRFERLSQKLLCRYLERLTLGRLLIELPSGAELVFGPEGQQQPVRIIVHDWSFFSRVLLGGDVAFGECYSDKIWSTDELQAVLTIFLNNVNELNDRKIPFTALRQKLNAIWHRRRANTKPGSAKNIPAHYDLGNELFSRFLDGRLVYSCAAFQEPGESLEQAQLNKLRSMIKKARIEAKHHLLEIGGGWGAFAIEAVKQTGCRVTTITLSEQQLAYMKQQVEQAGLTDRIDVRLCDYREIEGKFDRIVSIEMLEAVGHENLGTFFSTCDRLLNPNGVMALQFITVPDQNYAAYRRSCDWIQKYIFPGGHCPSLTAVCNAATKHSPFVVEELENIGPSYARTLREWRKRFFEKTAELSSLGYDERFQRMWEYYLVYCETGFAGRQLGTLQLVLTRPNNTQLGNCPGYPQ